MRRASKFRKPSTDDWRSQGRGAEYEPGFTVGDVPSRGLSSRPLGWKSGRVQHFVSMLEESYFYTLEWSTQVIDIREQFRLPLEATTAIAKKCGVKHPTKPATKELVKVTTDFLLTVRIGGGLVERARAVKQSQDLAGERTLEKLEIERRYWEAQKIDWKIVTENDIRRPLVNNIKWVYPYRDLNKHPGLTAAAVSRIEKALTPAVRDGNRPLSAFTDECDDSLGQPPGTSLTVVRHLLATRRWIADMSIPIDPSQPVTLVTAQTVTSEESHGAIYQLSNRVA